jgi:MFS family permease
VSWGALARRRHFRRLWLGDAVSLLGDWFTYVAVGTLALAGGGLLSVALVLVAHTLPRALLAPFAGALADRHDRRTIMVVASLLRAAVVVVMAMAAAAEAIAAVELLLFVRMALGAFVDPAARASLPQLVPRALLGRANALLGATWSLVFAVGVGLGGLAAAAIGPVGALVIDAATFVIAAAVLATLPRLRPGAAVAEAEVEARDRVDAPADREGAAKPRRGEATLGDGDDDGDDDDDGRMRDAWRVAWRRPVILEAALAKVPVMLASGGAWILLHAVAEGLGEVALALGALHSARAVGTGLGPLVWARAARLGGERLGLHAAAGLCLVAVALFAVVDSPPWLLLGAGLWGFATGASWVTSATRIQLLAPNRALGRIAAIDLFALSICQCVAGVSGALVAEALDWPAASAWLGVGAGLVAWIGLVAVVRRGGRSEVDA